METDKRGLSIKEINTLIHQGCTAEDWTAILVADEFKPDFIHRVNFSGQVVLGLFQKSLEVEEGFFRHSGLFDATLCDVTVGDNCLIERVGGYLRGYDFGEECIVSHVGVMTASADATYGQLQAISVLSEAGTPNVVLFGGLTAQLAALMTRLPQRAWHNLRQLIADDWALRRPERAAVGARAKIVGAENIVNTLIEEECEVNGALRISESTLMSTAESAAYVGHGAIIDSCIVASGGTVEDGAKLASCFVGEACHVGRGASGEASLLFANSYVDNGELCAAFLGPFSVTHHKSTLLIAGEYEMYNAGSATNYSNHAYKSGPLHWGQMDRGTKTASGAHVLWPAHIGSFSMVMGKVETHPDTTTLPFAYLFGQGDTTTLVPGRNLTTVGTYRDVAKWPKRDRRASDARDTLVRFDWLSPLTAQQCLDGLEVLMQWAQRAEERDADLTVGGCRVALRHRERGIEAYRLALRMFFGEQVERHGNALPQTPIGAGRWTELSGMLLPDTELESLTEALDDDKLDSLADLTDRLAALHHAYHDMAWAWAWAHMPAFYGREELTDDDFDFILADARQARSQWIAAIERDARHEFALGDMPEEALDEVLKQIK